MSARQPQSRARRERTARESLGAIVLGFEIVVVFLGALVVFGLKALPAGEALIGGGVLIVLMIVAVPLQRFQIGYWLGWFVQLVVVASGFLVGMLFIVGAIFAAIWAYAMIAGARLDHRTAAYRETNAGTRPGASDPAHEPDPDFRSDPDRKENE